MMKLDYSITSPEERRDLVDKIIAEVGIDNLNPKALEIMTDYIIFCMEKQEKKQKEILTDNRMTTVNKREASMEGLTEKLENGIDQQKVREYLKFAQQQMGKDPRYGALQIYYDVDPL